MRSFVSLHLSFQSIVCSFVLIFVGYFLPSSLFLFVVSFLCCYGLTCFLAFFFPFSINDETRQSEWISRERDLRALAYSVIPPLITLVIYTHNNCSFFECLCVSLLTHSVCNFFRHSRVHVVRGGDQVLVEKQV